VIKDFTEKTLSTKTVYHGKMIQVNVEQVLLPNGRKSEREIVLHPGAVGILAITSAEKIILVKQFRKALNQAILEIPAGKLESGEDPSSCAARELKEETGYTTTNMTQIGKFHTSPGFSDEVIYLFQAKGLQSGKAVPDADEFVELMELSFDEAIEMVNKGNIVDAKTLIAIQAWQIERLKG